MNYSEERQVTNDSDYNHDLDNNDNFSPDDQWLVYDTRTDLGGIAASSKVEKVNITTGEKKVLYRIDGNEDFGPGVGAVSFSPVENEIVFIHGLGNSSESNPYQQWRRSGVIVNESNLDKPIFMDARDIDAPYTKGALRGGSHRHEFSGDGNWVGFTYNDAIMQALEVSTGEKHNLRTIGVSKRGQAVSVTQSGENFSGKWFSALVVRVVPQPIPGSDEISHAAGDSWVGKNGYLKADGKLQLARAFIGTTKNKDGENVDEVFIVDIPEDISKNGAFGPLEGTETSLPMPPKGATQRRLTFTANTSQSGCEGIVRASYDGSTLAFLAKDENGIKQIFTINPNGGEMTQVTFQDTDVEGSVRWHPNGKGLFYICEKSIFFCQLGSSRIDKKLTQISKPTDDSPTNLVVSHSGKLLAFNRIVKYKEKAAKQIFVIKLED
ncbi:Protein of unknown function [Spirosomataceae bacterium TFI 002]|nr:Protein of unknown function [Spirosomataceae bacterium TFI 002]